MKSPVENSEKPKTFDDLIFDEDYFERGETSGKSLYTDYRWLPELTIPMCADVIFQLNIGYDERILDFGCAKGYAVHAFRLLHRKAFGVDVSRYAIGQAPKEVRKYVSRIDPNGIIPLVENRKYDWIFSKDVLEHVPHELIVELLVRLRHACKKAFFVIPLGDGKKYFAPPNELDLTHFIREDLPWWKDRFAEAGFVVKQAEYNMGYIKTKFSSWEHSTGFFVLE